MKGTHNDRSCRPHWLALLGRRDMPTDGVEDYCDFLARAMEPHGVRVEKARVEPYEKDWRKTLHGLARRSRDGRCDWVLLQYTSLGWSWHGFPFFALLAVRLLKRHGVRVAIVFHEFGRQQGSRVIDSIRGACQDWVIRTLYRTSDASIFTTSLDRVPWLPANRTKAHYIPIGANIPERTQERSMAAQDRNCRTVIVFGITGIPQLEKEVQVIGETLDATAQALGKIRLVVIGRGAAEAAPLLQNRLASSNVELVDRGILSADDVADEFARADALLFVRGPITLQRGSMIAGIATGTPIVGYADNSKIGPLQEAGIGWADRPDAALLARALIRVLSDSEYWSLLHKRNLEVQRHYLSWNRIAEQFRSALKS